MVICCTLCCYSKVVCLFGCLVSAVHCVVAVIWIVWLVGICCTLCCYSKVGCLWWVFVVLCVVTVRCVVYDGYLLCSVLLK